MKRQVVASIVLAVLYLAPLTAIEAQIPAAPQSVFYVTVKGQKQGLFKGESTRKGEEGKIQGVRFSMQVTSPRDIATGQASGKRQFSPITFTKEWGPSSPQFLTALSANENLNTVTFEFQKNLLTGQIVVFQTITLTNATVSSVRRYIGISTANEPLDPRELEDISFTFQKIELSDKATGGATYVDDWMQVR